MTRALSKPPLLVTYSTRAARWAAFCSWLEFRAFFIQPSLERRFHGCNAGMISINVLLKLELSQVPLSSSEMFPKKKGSTELSNDRRGMDTKVFFHFLYRRYTWGPC